MRNFLKALILIIVFGVPVFWYLFLQLFGENKFDLPTLGEVEVNCIKNENRLLIFKDIESVYEQNLLSRIEQNKYTSTLLISTDRGCLNSPEHDMYLVDEYGKVRGTYKFSSEDVERLMVETQLLLELNGIAGK